MRRASTRGFSSGPGVGGRSLLNFDDVPGVIVGVKLASSVLDMSGVGLGRLGERRGSSGVDGRGVLAAEVMTCKGELNFRASDDSLGLYVDPVCPNFLDVRVRGATVGEDGLEPPKAIGRSRLFAEGFPT